jgi:hypothetical protein
MAAVPSCHGADYRVDDLLRMRDADARAAVDALGPYGANQYRGGVDTINSSSGQGGTASRYTLARLKRDRPDLAARVAV